MHYLFEYRRCSYLPESQDPQARRRAKRLAQRLAKERTENKPSDRADRARDVHATEA